MWLVTGAQDLVLFSLDTGIRQVGADCSDCCRSDYESERNVDAHFTRWKPCVLTHTNCVSKSIIDMVNSLPGKELFESVSPIARFVLNPSGPCVVDIG
jgi:hypothetical protein